MNQQRLLFEYHPAFLLACLALGVGYAFVLYQKKYTWTLTVNRLLFGLRTIVVTAVAFLILGPFLKLTHNTVEKPEIVFLVDNSLSVKEAAKPEQLSVINNNLKVLGGRLEKAGYDVSLRDLSDGEIQTPIFNYPTSDLSGALRDINSHYEGKNLAGILLFTDAIYNSGSSPLYTPLRVPVFTVGIGDTTDRVDVALKNLVFNKIAYQGNKFPMRAEVLIDGLPDQNIKVSLYHKGKLSGSQTKNSSRTSLLNFDFELDAVDKGMQRIDVVVEAAPNEQNLLNNQASGFVEVVEGKKKILVIAPAPHPDIKALRAVVEKNSNYEFILHIPGVKEADPSMLIPNKADLTIFHQALDAQGKTNALFDRFNKSNAARLIMLGTGSNFRLLQDAQIPLVFERAGQWDEVTPVINSAFRDFSFAENSNATFAKYPPASVPFGKFTFPSSASILLYQQIGSVTTDRPMLLTYDENGKKTGVLIAEGIWRWRLNEYSETEKSEIFDDVFAKLIQYLSTQEDKRKFRCFPLQNEFSDATPVIFESQLYNDLFEQVYGNTVEITLRDERGKATTYNYVTSAGSTRYRIGGLKEGLYQYTGSTGINGQRESVKGEFLVKARNIESQNLTADFGLLRKLSLATGGKFYSVASMNNLEKDLPLINAKGLIHSEEAFNPMINLKWVFFLILLMVSAEWFVRKYQGAY